MRLIIAGGRNLRPSFQFIFGAIKLHGINNITEIVSGAAEGVDNEGIHFASHMNLDLTKFPAEWDKHGKAAGPIRNRKMAVYADVLLLIWNGESKGSSNMKQEMLKLKKPVYEVILNSENAVL